MFRSFPRRALALSFLAVVFLTAARCGPPVITASGPLGSTKGLTPTAGIGPSWSPNSNPAGNDAVDLFILINNRRASLGLKGLTWHNGLAAVAKEHTSDMRERDYFALVSPEGYDMLRRLVSSTPRIDWNSGYAFLSSGGGAQANFDAMWASGPGKAAITDANMTHFGAQGIVSEKGGTILFGSGVVP